VGPYTAVGERTKVIHSEVEYSILLNDAALYHLPHRLDASVIGQGAVVDGRGSHPMKNTLQLVLGDYSQVKL
jgi:glucose-1-phosphate thymidylyltransferase